MIVIFMFSSVNLPVISHSVFNSMQLLYCLRWNGWVFTRTFISANNPSIGAFNRHVEKRIGVLILRILLDQPYQDSTSFTVETVPLFGSSITGFYVFYRREYPTFSSPFESHLSLLYFVPLSIITFTATSLPRSHLSIYLCIVNTHNALSTVAEKEGNELEGRSQASL